MLSADAIQLLAKMAKSEIQAHNKKLFHIGPDGATLLKFPKVETLHVFGLTQLLNFVNVSKMEKVFINVLTETRVQLILNALGSNDEVVVLCDADFSKVYKSFPFGNQLSQEDFIIELMSKFEQDEVRDRLLKLVSSVKAEKVRSSDDDGFSQVASMKAGTVLVKDEKIQNIWELQTYKTFPEVEQPIIPYILRLHQRSEEMPRFALYDCDGGAWKVKTTSKIRELCQKFISDHQLDGKVSVL